MGIYGWPVHKRIWPLLAALLIVSSCAGGETEATTTATVTSSASPSTTTTVAVSATTTTAATTTTGQEIDVYFEDGQVVGPDRFDYALGEPVSIWILSDSDQEIHVHGYDVSVDSRAGVPLQISLTADVPGIFEVEIEETHALLFELVVNS